MNSNELSTKVDVAYAELVKAAELGSSPAEQKLYSQLMPKARSYLSHRRLEAEVEDLAHEAFIVFLNKVRNGELGEPERASSYFIGIVKNLLIGYQRKGARRKTTPDSIAIESAHDETSTNTEELTHRSELAQCLNRGLGKLTTERDRDLLCKYYLQDSRRADICFEMGLTAEQFSRVLYRARARLRHILSDTEAVLYI